MPPSYTPVRAPNGRYTHAWSTSSPDNRTACKRPCSGWGVTDREMDCPRCKAAMEGK